MDSRSFGRVPWPVGFVLVAILATAARGSDAEIVVASAISLREPLATIARDFETAHPGVRVHLTFGASGAMATQVRAGAPIDVLISADERLVADLSMDAHIDGGSLRSVAHNHLVVIAAAGFSAEIGAPEDLVGPEVRRIAIPEPSVPLGAYSRSWLRNANLLDAIAPRIIPTAHARATLAAVESGHVDLAIVYATDARLARHSRVAFEIPRAEQPLITYAAVRVRDSKRPELAEDFLEVLGGDAAQTVLRAAGFVTP
jgi:molybdate transport system substrate-binding protein